MSRYVQMYPLEVLHASSSKALFTVMCYRMHCTASRLSIHLKGRLTLTQTTPQFVITAI